MPVPTADLFDKQQNQANGTHPLNPATRPAEQKPDDSYFGARPGSSGTSHNADSGRPLTREEADRLYEERMEEEYAKREGGA